MTTDTTDTLRDQETIATIEGSLLDAYRDAIPPEYSVPSLTLTQAMLRIMANYEQFAKRHGLTTNGLLTLTVIRFADVPCTQRLISKLLLIPKQTVSSIIASFKKQGYVAEKPSPSDGRAKMLVLTEEGAAFSDHVLSELSELERTALQANSREEMEAAVRVANVYTDAFERGLAKLEDDAETRTP